jgi:hypothetical protein
MEARFCRLEVLEGGDLTVGLLLGGRNVAAGLNLSTM